MLWKFGFSASNVDALLSREVPPSIEELMDEQEILNECKAQNNRLITYLSNEETVKSLLQWVVSGLDELDQQAQLADSAVFDYAISSPALYPSYQLHRSPVPGPGPNSPPLEPTKIADAQLEEGNKEEERFPGIGLGEGLSRTESSGSDTSRSRYPQVAAEILTSDLWIIPEIIMSNSDNLLLPFWDAVLPPIAPASSPSTEASLSKSRLEQSERERARDEFWSEKDEERDRRREIIRGLWTRVNTTLMTKRTHAMVWWIREVPNVVERLMAQIASPAIQDMLIRIVSAEEAGVSGVVQWLADEGLVAQLLELLSPEHPPSMHSIASELLKSIITLCAPAPFNPNGGNTMTGPQIGNVSQPPGTRDNRMIRELVSEKNINILVGYMLDPVECTDKDWQGLNGPDGPPHPADPFVVHPLPSLASVSSSLAHVCNIFVEIIRRNNSDFSEPHLFHTLRQRLTLIQQQQGPTSGENMGDQIRQDLERALAEMSGKMGIVHLGHLITVLSDRFAEVHQLLIKPRSQSRAASVNMTKPLTLERFRVVELYAELLHSSNMSILNRQEGTGPSYTSEGILSGGLAGVEALGEAVEAERNDDDGASEISNHVTPARELPVSSGSTDCSLTGSEEVGSVDEEILEQIDDDVTPSSSPVASKVLDMPSIGSNQTIETADSSESTDTTIPPPPSRADDLRLRAVRDMDPPSIPGSSVASDVASISHAAVVATTAAPSVVSERESTHEPATMQSDETLPPGDRLKQMYIQHHVLPAVVDLFFEYPQNDFMHHVVYDLLQQILNGRLGPGLNRELVIELLHEAKLIERVLDAQRLNDEVIKDKRKPRLPFMGHVILIAEELVKFLARCPPDLYEVISPSFNQSEWEAFAQGKLRETKDAEAKPLAGGRPAGSAAAAAAAEEAEDRDTSSDEDEEPAGGHSFGEPLSRTMAQNGYAGRTGYDSFAERDDDEEFWSGGNNLNRRHVDSSDEDDDDDADWLRPSSANLHGGSDDEDFGNTGRDRAAVGDDFDDDGWGTFNPSSNDDGDNPFGDDNFAPSVMPPALSRQTPLTPHDWASEFDREFGDEPPAIVMPNMAEDEEEAEEPELGGPSRGWTFTGEDRGEDLPPSPSLDEVPVLPAKPTMPEKDKKKEEQVRQKGDENAEITVEKPLDKPVEKPEEKAVEKPVSQEDDLVQKTAAIQISPQRVPLSLGQVVGSPSSPSSPTSPIKIKSRRSSTSSTSPVRISTSPRTSLSPRSGPSHPGSRSPTSPITIPRRYSSTDMSTISLSPSSSSSSVHSLSGAHVNPAQALGEAYSPPEASLLNAVSEDRPLGPGVSKDTHVTSSGMLEKEVNGQKVVVPADEVVRGVEEASKGDL